MYFCYCPVIIKAIVFQILQLLNTALKLNSPSLATVIEKIYQERCPPCTKLSITTQSISQLFSQRTSYRFFQRSQYVSSLIPMCVNMTWIPDPHDVSKGSHKWQPVILQPLIMNFPKAWTESQRHSSFSRVLVFHFSIIAVAPFTIAEKTHPDFWPCSIDQSVYTLSFSTLA